MSEIKDLVKEFVTNSGEMSVVEAKISKAIATFNEELHVFQEKDIQMREAIKDAMKNTDTKKFENDVIAITYVAPTTRITLDTQRLKLSKPNLWKEYSKTSDVKDSIRIKIL